MNVISFIFLSTKSVFLIPSVTVDETLSFNYEEIEFVLLHYFDWHERRLSLAYLIRMVELFNEHLM